MLDEQELDNRIQRFLSRKSQEFPGLNYEFSGSSFVETNLDEEDYDYRN